MHISKNQDLLLVNIARAADLSMKPWIHSVLDTCTYKSEVKGTDPEALDLTKREKFALGQVRGSVAQNKAKLKQIQIDQKINNVRLKDRLAFQASAGGRQGPRNLDFGLRSNRKLSNKLVSGSIPE